MNSIILEKKTNVSEKINDFSAQTVWAVVGATPRQEKPGYQIYRDLKEAGYRVYPVHLSAQEIDGDKAYSSLSQLPELPDVVDVVVPPPAALEVVKEAASLGVKRVWFQPGTESEEALNFCRENGINFIAHLCVMKDMLKSR